VNALYAQKLCEAKKNRAERRQRPNPPANESRRADSNRRPFPCHHKQSRRAPGAELIRRVGPVVGYPPLSELNDLQRREFHEALLEAASFEDLPGKWQAAIMEAERNRPKLRLIRSD
jgi:hypothetical protein